MSNIPEGKIWSFWAYHNQLKMMILIIFTKIVNKVDIDVTERDMQAVHCIGKEGRTNIKFSNRKDCQALPKVKRDLNNVSMKDLVSRRTTKLM